MDVFLIQKVACANGAWKSVSLRACHWAGKSVEVLKARKLKLAQCRDVQHIGVYRRTMIRCANATVEGDLSLMPTTTVPEFVQALVTQAVHSGYRNPFAGTSRTGSSQATQNTPCIQNDSCPSARNRRPSADPQRMEHPRTPSPEGATPKRKPAHL